MDYLPVDLSIILSNSDEGFYMAFFANQYSS